MSTFEEACVNADLQLDAGGDAFIVVARFSNFYMAKTAEEVGEGRVIVYFSRYCGGNRNYNLYGAEAAGSA